LQRVPTEPVKIDLPSLSTTETTKESHKDFYKQDEDKNKEDADTEAKDSLL